MAAFTKVRELVDDDVLKAAWVLFGELQVEPDVRGVGVAGAPLGLHPTNGPRGCRPANS